jgi:hypothetical protein
VIDVLHPLGVEGRRPSDESIDLIPLGRSSSARYNEIYHLGA